MCLAIPGRIISTKEDIAQVDFLGVTKEANISLIDFELKKDDYVLVHAGFVIQKLSNEEAESSIEGFNEMM